MPSSRRALLTGVGAALTGLAGCLDFGGGTNQPSSPTGTSTATPSPTSTPPALTDTTLGNAIALDTDGDGRGDGMVVVVSDLVSAHSIRYLTAPDAFGVADAGGQQFALVHVAARGEGTPPTPDDFSLVADGTTYESGIASVGPARVDDPVSGRPYGGSDRRGYLGFRVPAPLDADTVAIQLAETGRWTVSDSELDALRSPPPAFSTRIEVPERVAADEAISVRIDVTNEGEGLGTFHGAINHQGPLYAADAFSFSLPPGESTTHEATVGYFRGSESPPARVQFGVVGPGVSESFTVSIEGGGTPSGTATVTDTPS
ncbi:hypothetical protein [Haloplanus rubicundus]|uniref:Uncharacterized protein n=1 Tax=Haloplanus rubicundus TaxID=1547898 RepID=A0A345EBG8_9EURY|nr:hypothetical protein [Haloplanus rubicundus]AXG09540.1 hypothetical protein DU484_06460 [Haloplanus rubicundus]